MALEFTQPLTEMRARRYFWVQSAKSMCKTGKIKKKSLFPDKHGILRARIRVSHKRRACKDIRFGGAISLI
jgi:hypothetical protein